MPSKVPAQFEGHEAKVEELIFYVRYAKRVFYIAFWIMAVNVFLTLGLLFHPPRGLSPEMCSKHCHLDMYSHTTHENVIIPRMNDSSTLNTTFIAREVESKVLEVGDKTKSKDSMLIQTVLRYVTNGL
jgi:hypothetical protein